MVIPILLVSVSAAALAQSAPAAPQPVAAAVVSIGVVALDPAADSSAPASMAGGGPVYLVETSAAIGVVQGYTQDPRLAVLVPARNVIELSRVPTGSRTPYGSL